MGSVNCAIDSINTPRALSSESDSLSPTPLFSPASDVLTSDSQSSTPELSKGPPNPSNTVSWFRSSDDLHTPDAMNNAYHRWDDQDAAQMHPVPRDRQVVELSDDDEDEFEDALDSLDSLDGEDYFDEDDYDDEVQVLEHLNRPDAGTGNTAPDVIPNQPAHPRIAPLPLDDNMHRLRQGAFDEGPPALQRQLAPVANYSPNWADYEEDFDPAGYFIDEMQDELGSRSMLLSMAGPAEPAQAPKIETNLECVNMVLTVFPGICPDYVSKLYETLSKSSDELIAHVLDQTEQGVSYPKAKDMQKTLKRKREVDEDEAAIRRYNDVERVVPQGTDKMYIRTLLSLEFPLTPMTFVDASLAQAGYRLFSAYRILEEAERTWASPNPPYNRIKHPRKMTPQHLPENLEAYINAAAAGNETVEVLRELQAARKVRKRADDQRAAERQAQLDEEENVRKAEAEGTMSECGCCFGDFPLNRMVHCDNEKVLHWFCRGCAKQTAENEIGNSKYILRCMSMDGCQAGFAMDQRSEFLDQKTLTALERNEQEAMLRMAGIENLASCPFCPFAAEYPPVEINREFRCQAPDCEKVSCRLCNLESHIPKSCEENAKDNGLSIRRQIEEAMSAALIRKCNKCGTPFVKEEGCNKMTCTRNGCFNVQCYVCSKSCSYDHFDDSRRGGKPGNCPLFESVEQRHDEEVKKAEKEALEKVRAEHPEYSEDDLKVKMSENVKKDDEKRKAKDPAARFAGLGARAQALERGRRLRYYEFEPQQLGGDPPARIAPQRGPRGRAVDNFDELLNELGNDPMGLGIGHDQILGFDEDIFAGLFDEPVQPPRLEAQLPAPALPPIAPQPQLGNGVLPAAQQGGRVEQPRAALNRMQHHPATLIHAQQFARHQAGIPPVVLQPIYPHGYHQPRQNNVEHKNPLDIADFGLLIAQGGHLARQQEMDRLDRHKMEVRAQPPGLPNWGNNRQDINILHARNEQIQREVQDLLQLRQQKIIQSAERRFHRQQEIMRLARENQQEEADVAEHLARLRSHFPAAGPSRQ